MDSVSMDHYEKQLYTVFKTFDVDNEEALDRSAVLDLCNALQLDDRSAILVDTLFEKPEDRVTFTQFRNGLLTVLGGGDAPSTSTPALLPSDDDSSGREVAPKYIYGSKKYGRRSKPQTMGSSSGYESCNKVLSPESSHIFIPNLSDNDAKKHKLSLKSKKVGNEGSRLQDEDCNLDHDRYIDYEESIALCKSLQMGGIDKQIVKQIFTSHSSVTNKKLTIGEFFQRLNNCLTMSIASTCQTDSVISNDNSLTCAPLDTGTSNGLVETKRVLDAWEQAGIDHGVRLLHELGFTTTTLQISELSDAIDEELRALTIQHTPPPHDARALLLQASLALHRFQFIRIKNIMEQVLIENNKLKNDLSDANHRAQVLAQEVDENHVRMENSLKNQIRQLELKHTDNVRSMATEWTAEKEKIIIRIAELEEATSVLTAEETILKADNKNLAEENEELRKKITCCEVTISELESIRTHLNQELKSLVSAKDEIKLGIDEQNTITDLTNHINDLKLENKLLKDRNDELCAEVDSLTSNVSRDDQRSFFLNSDVMPYCVGTEKAASWHDETDGFDANERPGKRRGDSPSSAFARLSDDESPRVGKLRKRLMNQSNNDTLDASTLDVDNSSEGPTSLTLLNVTHQSQDCDSSLISLDHKFIGHLEIKRQLEKILDNTKISSLPDTISCESCKNLKDFIAIITGQIKDMSSSIIYTDQSIKMETTTISVQTEGEDEVTNLKEKIKNMDSTHVIEIKKYETTINELQASVEQLKSEYYDKCEEYWLSKLDQEREMHNEELKLSDERYNELVSKINEYEEQFAPKHNNSTLPTIDEKYNLEVQFSDLEAEFENYKKEKDDELNNKNLEIEILKEKVMKLEEAKCNHSPSWEKEDGSATSSPIAYLWSQGTIASPYTKDNKPSVRDYQNPDFVQSSQVNKPEEKENVRCSSDSERERGLLKPIQRPAMGQRSSSVGALQDDRQDSNQLPNMIHCSELEGHLRRQHVKSSVPAAECGGCTMLEHRCRQLQNALRQHQYILDSVQQAARSESIALRSRISAAEGAVTRLQSRLAAADVLVKDLFFENCQLAHQSQHRLQ